MSSGSILPLLEKLLADMIIKKDQNYLEFIIFMFLIIPVTFILEKKMMMKPLNGN